MPASSLPSENTAPLESATPPAYDGPRCEKCEAPLPPDQMVCRSCGYYASMGTFVELDAEWEAAIDPTVGEAAPSQTALEEVASLIPVWAWVLLGTHLAIVVGSIAGRLAMGAEGVAESWWGVGQFVGGVALALMLHVTCFVMIASENSDMGVLDLIVSPFKAWKKVCDDLPDRNWLLSGFTGGIVAAICAALIVGGIPWERVWDWNIKQPTKSSLVDAITSAAGSLPAEEKPIEEAVADFAGEAGNLHEPVAKKQSEKPQPRKSTDCLIVGYNLDDREEIKYLLIATDSNGRLVYAGQIVPELNPKEKRRLKNRLMQAHTGRPFVKTGREAAWVQPRFPIRVTYTKQATNGKLLEMKWGESLDELKLPW